MKKFLLLSSFVVGALMTNAAGIPGNTVTIPYGTIDMAIDGENMYRCIAVKSNNDVEYTILNPDFSVLKKFRLKNIVNNSDNGFQLIPYYLEVEAVDINYEVIATKGLFSSDGKWCVVMWTESGDNDSYSVYNEDGQKLFDLPISHYVDNYNMEEYSPGDIYLDNVTTGKPVYVTYNGYDTPDDGQSMEYTSWTFNTSSVNAPAVSNKFKVYPNPLSNGNPLTVELPAPADAHTIFIVNDLKGRQAFRREVARGENSFRVSPRFTNGAYVYTVIYSDGSSFSGKLIAK